MAFNEIQFPPNLSYGATGGPQRLTEVVALKSGHEERNQVWAHSRRSYDASTGLRNLGHLHDIIDFWEARRGMLHGFRWKDWADYKTSRGKAVITSTDMLIGTGDAIIVDFQLIKNYINGGDTYTRDIQKPVAGTVLVSLDDVDTTAFTLDDTTGIITFDAAPGTGVVIKAGFEFDVPVRFDNDTLLVSIDAFEAGNIPSIDVIEIRLK